MQIACPRCDESYRLEPGNLPGTRVRSACLSCGETLFLRLVDGAVGGDVASRVADDRMGRAEAARADEVPLWGERPADLPGSAGTEVLASTEPESFETPAATAPGAAELGEGAAPERAAAADEGTPTELALAGELATGDATGLEENPVRLEASAPPEARAAPEALSEKPLAPFLEPPVQPDELGDRAPAAEKPLIPYLEPPVEPTLEQSGAGSRAGFTFSRVGDVSARAQRLARALVSDILVYHPKKIEQGVREGSLKEIMKDEVDKSWDEYCERLGPDVARANRSHFVAALNEILARGRPVF